MSPAKLIIGGLAAIAAVVVYRTLRTAQAIEVSLRNVGLQFGGGSGAAATVMAQLRVINPTSFAASFKLPYVRILVNGDTVGRSTPTDSTISIAPNSDTSQGPIRVPLSVGELLAITDAINSGQKLELELSEMRHNGLLLPSKRIPVTLDGLGLRAARSIAQDPADTKSADVLKDEAKPFEPANALSVTSPARPEPVLAVEPVDNPYIGPTSPMDFPPGGLPSTDTVKLTEQLERNGQRMLVEQLELSGYNSPFRNAR
jgi:hypothetical protein